MWKVSTKYRLETKAKGSTRYRNPRGSHIEHERVHLYYQQDNQHASHTQITSIPLHLLIPPFLFLQLLYTQLSSMQSYSSFECTIHEWKHSFYNVKYYCSNFVLEILSSQQLLNLVSVIARPVTRSSTLASCASVGGSRLYTGLCQTASQFKSDCALQNHKITLPATLSWLAS